MVLLDSANAFFSELGQMFALCKERGAGTVYSTVKKVEAGNKQRKKNGQSEGAQGAKKEAAGGGGRREGWLVRAKMSNNKMRKISLLVSDAEIEQCRQRLEALRKSMPVCAIAGGTKKRGRKPAGGGSGGANTGKRPKGASGT